MTGKRIKKYLEERGITLTHVANKIGIGVSTLSYMLNSGNKIDVSIYYKICKALNVHFETFLSDEEEAI